MIFGCLSFVRISETEMSKKKKKDIYRFWRKIGKRTKKKQNQEDTKSQRRGLQVRVCCMWIPTSASAVLWSSTVAPSICAFLIATTTPPPFPFHFPFHTSPKDPDPTRSVDSRSSGITSKSLLERDRGVGGGGTFELAILTCLKGMRLETDFCCGIVLREETSCCINEHICILNQSNNHTNTKPKKTNIQTKEKHQHWRRKQR